MSPWASSLNFGFLASADTLLVRTAALAERYFPEDPVTSLMKLRQFGEALAQQVAARTGVFTSADEPQADLLGRLRREAGSPREVLDLFHDLRRIGNEATHQHKGDHATALTGLKIARQLAIWFHRTYTIAASSPVRFSHPSPARPVRGATRGTRAPEGRTRSDPFGGGGCRSGAPCGGAARPGGGRGPGFLGALCR